MPALYAHRRFGAQVLERLPQPERDLIERYRSLYDIGLHGPDILFFYRPWSGNRVSRTGSRAHTIPGRLFFSQMWEVVQQQSDPAPYLAYLYGVLCHYTLDSACHGYINEMGNTSPYSHGQIESELERYFLIADGKDPMRGRNTDHLHPRRENAEIIAAFYPQLTARQIQESLGWMVVVEDLWVASNPGKRGLVLGITTAVGQGEYAKSLMRPYNAPADCVGLLPPILEMYDRAVPRAARFIRDFPDMAQGVIPYDPCFKLPFDPQTAAEAPVDEPG